MIGAWRGERGREEGWSGQRSAMVAGDSSVEHGNESRASRRLEDMVSSV